MAALATTAVLLAACTATTPGTSSPGVSSGRTAEPAPTTAPSPTPTGAERPTDGGTASPSRPDADVLPADYPWEPRADPPPLADVNVAGEPWLGGLSSLDPDDGLEVPADGPGPYALTGVEMYEQGESQSRVVVSYDGDGLAGLLTSVVGPTELPPGVEVPDGVDTAFVRIPGATDPLGGDLVAGRRVDAPPLRYVGGVSVGTPDENGTTLYVGLPEGTTVWYVVDHPGTLVIVATNPA
ncbi:hypothetical protein [Georgenia muralis]